MEDAESVAPLPRGRPSRPRPSTLLLGKRANAMPAWVTSPSHRSQGQIAAEMYVSVNTVKTPYPRRVSQAGRRLPFGGRVRRPGPEADLKPSKRPQGPAAGPRGRRRGPRSRRQGSGASSGGPGAGGKAQEPAARLRDRRLRDPGRVFVVPSRTSERIRCAASPPRGVKRHDQLGLPGGGPPICKRGAQKTCRSPPSSGAAAPSTWARGDNAGPR